MKLVVANLFRLAALALLLILLFRTEWLSFLLTPLTSNNAPAVYTQNSLASLAAGHLQLVVGSIACSAVLAVLGGIFVTRESGADFLPLSRAIANAGQTFPPVAVLALAVPATGFRRHADADRTVSLPPSADLREYRRRSQASVRRMCLMPPTAWA